jgi:hypothetical protein
VGIDRAADPASVNFVEAHSRALGLAAMSGVALGLVVWALETRLERQNAEITSSCGTFSECMEPTGEFVLLVAFFALLVPTVVLVPARVTRAWLVVPLGGIVALFLGMVWSDVADLLDLASVVPLVVGTAASYVLTELMVGRGYAPALRWGALSVTVLVLVARQMFVG